jgi:hypothetical protein
MSGSVTSAASPQSCHHITATMTGVAIAVSTSCGM